MISRNGPQLKDFDYLRAIELWKSMKNDISFEITVNS